MTRSVALGSGRALLLHETSGLQRHPPRLARSDSDDDEQSGRMTRRYRDL
jgi:hypothetical protein